MAKVWVVRAGSDGEQEPTNLDDNVATIGWNVGDLSSAQSREAVRQLIDTAYPDDSQGRRANITGQIWAFRSRIEQGDIVVMPSKLRSGYLYLGICQSGYVYDASAPDHRRRHKIAVHWSADAVSKSVIKDDLLYSLNAIMTVFNPTRNNAAERMQYLYQHGKDPGSHDLLQPAQNPISSPSGAVVEDHVTDPDLRPTLEAIRDRIRTHLVENFGDHKLTRLVADILEVLGYQCEVSPPGPDGGVDILAGRGPLGLDSPTLIVEVKSELSQVDVKVVRGLHSAMTQHQADQGLLVAWGGVTKPAHREFLRDRTSFRVWDSEALLDRLFETYDRLPAATRARIPLKQAWVLDEESA